MRLHAPLSLNDWPSTRAVPRKGFELGADHRAALSGADNILRKNLTRK
jgi:hypothetical protein